ncbi:MAG TPA: 6-phosphogluconolactonase [Acidisarcina sp.]|nr:6-phosphogluconolactonase [Acidisarcina sp.]
MSRTTEVLYFVYPDADSLARHAALRLVEQIEQAVSARGMARIAISGGNTPRRMLELLADPKAEYRARVPWQSLELYFVDERTVPPDHAESNYRMVREALLDQVPLKPEQVVRMQGELDTEEAAAKYESQIRMRFRLEGAELPRFDVVTLGMGDDGHTASLFPHTEAIDALGRIAVANHVPQKDTWRITLTWPVINQARDVFFLIQGADKAAVLARVLQGPFDPESLPTQLIRPVSGKLTMLLDSTAAAQLPPPGAEGFGRLEKTR